MRNKSVPKTAVYLVHKDNCISSSQISYMFRPNIVIIRLATRKKRQIFSQLYWKLDLVVLHVIFYKNVYIKLNNLGNKCGKNCKCWNF